MTHVIKVRRMHCNY